MAEHFSNDFATTLSAAIPDGAATSITVASGTGAPASSFRIRIDDELLLVTSTGAGTNWTVTRGIEGTTAVTHTLGTAVAHVLTDGGLRQYITDQFVPPTMQFTQTDVLLGRSSAGAGSGQEIPCTAFGRSVLAGVDAPAVRTTLGLGTMALEVATNYLTKAGNLAGLADVSASRANLGLAAFALVGALTGPVTSDAAGLTAITNKAVTYAKIQDVSATDKLLGRSSAGAGSVEEIACTAFGRSVIAGADAAAVRSTLGLGTMATVSNLTGPITSVGAATSIAAQTGTGTTFAMQASPTFTGQLTFPAGTAAAPGINLTGVQTGFFLGATNSRFCFSEAGTSKIAFGDGFVLRSVAAVFWSSTSDPDGSTLDVALYRDAAATIAQRNGGNAQALRVYATFTDASNYARLALDTAGGNIVLAAESAGSGGVRPMFLFNRTNGGITFGTNNTARWTISSSGDLTTGTDNLYDIGASGATRPRTGYFGTSVIIAGNTAATLATKLDVFAAPDDNTNLNASTSAHGLMMKYPGGTTTFLRADGAFTTLGLGTMATETATDYLTKVGNLAGLANLPTSRTNIGLGTGNSPQFTGLVLAGGGTPGVGDVTISVDNSGLLLRGATATGACAALALWGGASSSTGQFELLARDSGSQTTLTGTPAGALTWPGTIQGTRLISTIAIGTAPFTVTSTTKVTNLYADRAALADTVTTNANLTGPITSSGNATAIAAQTGTGTTFAMSVSPTFTGTVTAAALTATGTVTLATSGQRIVLYTTDATRANRTLFTESSTNGGFNAGFIPNGTSNICAFTCFAGSNPDATHGIQLITGATSVAINSGNFGGTQRDLSFQIGSATKALLDINGVFGYGPTALGIGGTVTQATSKATGATLSKVCGEITMNAAALAANTTVTFTLTNTLISAGDLIHLQHQSGGTAGAYSINGQAAAGSASINVRNVTAGSLSEAIVLRFAIIKGVTA